MNIFNNLLTKKGVMIKYYFDKVSLFIQCLEMKSILEIWYKVKKEK